jgi:hypothetical protein
MPVPVVLVNESLKRAARLETANIARATSESVTVLACDICIFIFLIPLHRPKAGIATKRGQIF